MQDNRPSSSRWLRTTGWLADHLDAPDVVVVDGSWHLPWMNGDASAEYAARHIPGAVFFDIDAIADHSTDLPHMLPGPDQFAQAAGRLGISERDTIVVYDSAGLFSAPRVWWTFRIFGAENVFILDGGLPQWLAEGRPVMSGPVTRKPRTFKATMNTAVVAMVDDVRLALTSGEAQVVDARPAERFRGQAPEPRPGVRPGHMPGARNVPTTTVLDGSRLASPEKIRQAFADGGVDLNQPVITSCGSGVSAATLWLALDSIGVTPRALYDGSWTEWGSRPDLPVATGK
jgi:thiosulfate/3-mercaptopyruvate sulfurtransferase